MRLSKGKRAVAFVAVALACGTVQLSAPLAQAAPPSTQQCFASTDASRAAIRDKIIELGATPSDDDIQRATGLQRVDGAGNRIANQPYEVMTKVAADGDMGVLAPNVTLAKPRFYTSTCGGIIDNYVVADFNFGHRRADGIKCTVCVTNVRNIGGFDGFGLSFSDKVYDRGASFATCDYEQQGWNRFACGKPTHLFDSGPYGKAWGFQDKAWYDVGGYFGTNADNGRIVYNYDRYPGSPTCVQAFSRYEHTWDSTAVTGIGVGKSDFSVSWSKTEHHWPTSSVGGDACP